MELLDASNHVVNLNFTSKIDIINYFCVHYVVYITLKELFFHTIWLKIISSNYYVPITPLLKVAKW